MLIPYWRLSSFYLFYFATLGAFIPYWSLYLKDNGFNSAEIGQLSAFLVGTKIVAPNLWGWIADHTHKSLHIIRWTSFYAAVLFSWYFCANNYLEFAVLTVAFSFFWNAPLPLYEALTLWHLHAESHRYSRIRLWGSIGFIIAVVGLGKLLDIKPINLLPIVITGLLILTWVTALATPPLAKPRSRTTAASIGNILKKPEVIAFLVVYVLNQFAHAPYYVFYSIYLQDHHYSTSITGLLWSLGVVAEIILFLLMKNVLRRYSLRNILLTSLVFSVLRWLMIGAFVDNLFLLMTAQLLHAATFGGTHIAAIHLVQRYFHEQHQSKGQGLYHSMSFGLGGMLGSLVSGHYWEVCGPYAVFSIAAASCALAFCIAYVWVK